MVIKQKSLSLLRNIAFYIKYIIHCEIKRDNHQVTKIVTVPGNEKKKDTNKDKKDKNTNNKKINK